MPELRVELLLAAIRTGPRDEGEVDCACVLGIWTGRWVGTALQAEVDVVVGGVDGAGRGAGGWAGGGVVAEVVEGEDFAAHCRQTIVLFSDGVGGSPDSGEMQESMAKKVFLIRDWLYVSN